VIRLEFNGKPFDPASLEEQIMKLAMEALGDEVRQKVSAIRDPDTGEFPTVVVRAISMTDIRCEVEGSEKLLKLVNERGRSDRSRIRLVSHRRRHIKSRTPHTGFGGTPSGIRPTPLIDSGANSCRMQLNPQCIHNFHNRCEFRIAVGR
jgi:hypothetical protein